MKDGEGSIVELLDDHPRLRDQLKLIFQVDRELDWWEFDDVPVDSGDFGEIVSYGVLESEGSRYRLADPDAVKRTLSGEQPTNSQPATEPPIAQSTLVRRVRSNLLNWLMERWGGVAMVAILGVALMIRLLELGSNPFFGDELWTAWASRMYLFGEGFSNPVGPSNPYLRSWATTSLPIAASFWWFGYTEFAGRLPIVLVGTAVILVWYLFARKLYDRRVALVFAAFLALEPYMLSWSRMARDYAPLQLFFIAGILLFYLWYDVDELRLRSKYLLALAAISLLGMHTHPSYLGLGPAILVFLVVSVLVDRLKLRLYEIVPSQSFIQRRLAIAAVCLVAGITFVALRGIPSQLTAAPGWYGGRSWDFYFQLFRTEYPLLYVIFFVGMVYHAVRDSGSRLLLLVFLIPFAAHTYSPWREPRYITHIYPAFLLLAISTATLAADALVRWLNDWEEPIKEFRKRDISLVNVAVALVGICLLTVSVSPWSAMLFVTENPHGYVEDRSDHRTPTADLEAHIEEEHAVISSTPHMTMWYLSRDRVDYMLSAQRPDGRIEAVDGVPMDTRTGTVALNENTSMLLETLDSHETGWFYADTRYRFYVSEEMKSTVENNMVRLSSDGWGHIDVYYWGPEEHLQELEANPDIEVHR